ncbi:hypothetical protein P7C70_g6254, partial [Phenoliferia sp. Uapishka_3]
MPSHRVITPPPPQTSFTRYSAVFFLRPYFEAELAPLSNLSSIIKDAAEKNEAIRTMEKGVTAGFRSILIVKDLLADLGSSLQSTATLLQNAYSEVEDALAALPIDVQTRTTSSISSKEPSLCGGRAQEPERTAFGIDGIVEESPLEVWAHYSTLVPSMTNLNPVRGPTKVDTDPSLDPVSRGILCEEDLERLLTL